MTTTRGEERWFNAYGACSKCGSQLVTVRHVRLFGGGEVMRRHCERCDYTWDELPLDHLNKVFTQTESP